MYKQRQYLKWRANRSKLKPQSDPWGQLHPSGRQQGLMGESPIGPWPNSPSWPVKMWPSCLILTWLYNTAYDWWLRFSVTDRKKGNYGQFVMSNQDSLRTDNRATGTTDTEVHSHGFWPGLDWYVELTGLYEVYRTLLCFCFVTSLATI